VPLPLQLLQIFEISLEIVVVLFIIGFILYYISLPLRKKRRRERAAAKEKYKEEQKLERIERYKLQIESRQNRKKIRRQQLKSRLIPSFLSLKKHKRSWDEDVFEKTNPTPENLKNELYFERANQHCEWCEEWVDTPEIHHIVPRSEGGKNTTGNLIVLCPNCHRKADHGVLSRSKLEYKLNRKTEK
tara:strand:+ start:15 stop:575 length:561 start_codon:yes stop_codon:yes gene_type:complete